jgi:hypothetical protein
MGEDEPEAAEQMRTLLNHLGGPLHLRRAVVEGILGDCDKMRWTGQLEELFSTPDEVWALELPTTHFAWRYVKFLPQGVLFGIVDAARFDELQIVDWYFKEHDATSALAPYQSAAIAAQRSGQLTYSRRHPELSL